MTLFLVCTLCYLFGSIPFGFLIAKAKGINILAEGSQSIGATNVNRVLGKGPGALVLLLDVLKGVLPPLLVPHLNIAWPLGLSANDWGAIGGALAIFGHTLSPFLKFKGGKGIATGVGCMLAIKPEIGIGSLAVFFLMMVLCRYVSLSSLVATTSMLGFAVIFQQDRTFMIVFTFIVVLVFVKHKNNIARLLKNEEPRFKMKSKV